MMCASLSCKLLSIHIWPVEPDGAGLKDDRAALRLSNESLPVRYGAYSLMIRVIKLKLVHAHN